MRRTFSDCSTYFSVTIDKYPKQHEKIWSKLFVQILHNNQLQAFPCCLSLSVCIPLPVSVLGSVLVSYRARVSVRACVRVCVCVLECA